ncbi:MAG: type II secretion system F family protein [Clostridiales bacterium]|jgi:type IV pilus assembly protein PilC|nr:type II secretion system F family protein [Clostridiales bacterium]
MSSFLTVLRSLRIRMTRIKQAEIILMLKQLSALVASGLPLVPSLVTMEEQTTNRKFKHTLALVRLEVEQGKSLSEAMDGFPRVFPLAVRNTIRVGETSGLLDTSLQQIAQFMEEQGTFRGELTTALIYPAIVFIATMGVLAFMVLVVIPQIIPFLQMMGGELPWNTKLLISVTNFVTKNIKNIGMALVACIMMFLVIHRTKQGRYRIDLIKMKLPLFGFLIRTSIIVQFSKTMFLLTGSGVTIVDALKTVRDVDKNTAVRRAIDLCIGRVLLGESLSEPMRKVSNIFPPLVRSMIKVGEETGTMDAAMGRIADIHYSILQSYIKKLNASLEPLLLVFLGGIVGFVAAAMIGGILSGYSIQ